MVFGGEMDTCISLRRDVVLFASLVVHHWTVRRQRHGRFVCRRHFGAGETRASDNPRCECRLVNLMFCLCVVAWSDHAGRERVAHGLKHVMDEEETTSACT